MEIAVSAGGVVGALACGHLLKAVGNVYLLLIVAGIQVLAYALTNICLQESLTGAVPVSTIFTLKRLFFLKEIYVVAPAIRPCLYRMTVLVVLKQKWACSAAKRDCLT